MSKLTEWAAKEEANLASISSTLDGITAGINELDAMIVAFQNSGGTLNTEDQAALDKIEAASAALKVKAEAISTVPPVGQPTPPPVL